MKKLRNLMDTPFTWGDYFKLAGAAYVIWLICYIIYLTVVGLISPVEWVNKKIDSLKRRFSSLIRFLLQTRVLGNKDP